MPELFFAPLIQKEILCEIVSNSRSLCSWGRLPFGLRRPAIKTAREKNRLVHNSHQRGQVSRRCHKISRPRPGHHWRGRKGRKVARLVQGADGGWGQDAGDPSNVRQVFLSNRREMTSQTTALAALALLRAGNRYRPNVERAVDFILRRVESSPADGLSITDAQRQTHTGPTEAWTYIDTSSPRCCWQSERSFARAGNARFEADWKVRCQDSEKPNDGGSWNVGGGWAPASEPPSLRAVCTKREEGCSG